MNHMQIERLLDKLADKKLSEKEIKKLVALFQERTPSDDLDKYFLRIWDGCHKYNADLKSDVLLQDLQKRLDLSPGTGHSRKVSALLPSLLKYAAIFIIAFILSWLLNSQFKRQPGTGEANMTGVHEVAVSLGSKSKIKLADGSVVNLNSGSKLTCPHLFNEKIRQVSLEGEAYFEVKADSTKPFYVNTSDVTIKVLGTSFNVKSYPESNTIETTLVSGKLEISDRSIVRRSLTRFNKPVVLMPNQKAVYIKDVNRLTLDDRNELKFESSQMKTPKLSLQDQIDIHPITAWKDNKLIFSNEKFEDLAIKLERWYDVKIIIKAPELRKERFTGTFENETTEQVLNALMMAEPFKYTMNKNEIIISNIETAGAK